MNNLFESSSSKAWHLRQDGQAFPVKVHMYCMGDEDLSSEAEVAAFLISSKSKDQDIAASVLDAWMALLIEEDISYDSNGEDITRLIVEEINKLPYKFQYPVSLGQLLSIHKELNNYNDVDTFYTYVDNVRDTLGDLQSEIRTSLNQQFCRVRYGGQYNTLSGNTEIWYRISSVGYNWVNTIYEFTASIKDIYSLSQITICRDSESDNGFDTSVEYFYKAKDGTYYKHLPIEEYFEEEHEHNPVFESITMNAGVLYALRRYLSTGYTYHEASRLIYESSIYKKNNFKYLLRNELRGHYVRESIYRGSDVPDRIYNNS